MSTKQTSLFLPSKLEWFPDFLRKVGEERSLSSHLSYLAVKDLLKRKLIPSRKGEDMLKNIQEKSLRTRPLKLKHKHEVVKFYIRKDFKPFLDVIDANFKSRSAYFWTLLVEHEKVSKEQLKQFNEIYLENSSDSFTKKRNTS